MRALPFGAIAVANGLAWLAVAVVRASDPTYWSPMTQTDYAAVYLYSAGLLTLGLCLARISADRVRVALWASRAGAAAVIAAGIANIVEDGLGVRDFGLLFIAGTLTATIAMLVLGIVLARSPASRALGVVVLVTLASFFLSKLGFFIIAITWIVVGTPQRLRSRLFSPPA